MKTTAPHLAALCAFAVVAASALVAASGAGASPANGRIPIDQVPMYGGMDRQAEPLLQRADADFIAQTSKAFGGREQAAKAWVEQGFKFHQSGRPDMAMKRFNQAWLLDPKNPEVYWGFGAVLHEQEKAHAAYDMLKRAYELGWRDAGFLADFGKVATVRVVEQKDLPAAQRAEFIAEGERYFAEALTSGQQAGYVHTVWASARYWAGDYTGAWQHVKHARAAGAPDNAKFLALLRQKMREPK